MEEKPKRRWLRYSTRTLLLAVTIFCVWLGWQVSIVRERRAALQLITNSGGEWTGWLDTNPPLPDDFPFPRGAHLSIIRRLLGDKPVMIVRLTEGNVADMRWLGKTLPESNIEVWHDPAFNQGPYGLWNRDLERLEWPASH